MGQIVFIPQTKNFDKDFKRPLSFSTGVSGIYPFFLIFNREMLVKDVGERLANHSSVPIGSHLKTLIRILHPHALPVHWDKISMHLNSVFLLEFLIRRSNTTEENKRDQLTLKLKGMMGQILNWTILQTVSGND